MISECVYVENVEKQCKLDFQPLLHYLNTKFNNENLSKVYYKANRNWLWDIHDPCFFYVRSDNTVEVQVLDVDLRLYGHVVAEVRALGYEAELVVFTAGLVGYICQLVRPFVVDDEEPPMGIDATAMRQVREGIDRSQWNNLTDEQRFETNGPLLPDFLWDYDECCPTDKCAIRVTYGIGQRQEVRYRCNGACRAYANERGNTETT